MACSAAPSTGGSGGSGAGGKGGSGTTASSSSGTGDGGGTLIGLDGGGTDAACPTAVTCADVGANCGPIADGCGGVLDCGTCTGNESCGGGGVPSVCGVAPCTPKTCAEQGLSCGPAGDGCGNTLDCGACVAPETCGGGGVGKCGNTTTCTPKTCADQGFNCGPAGDGCGNQLNCGTCTAPASCGGGGMASVCGVAPCTPKTCADFGAKACGPLGDGCGGLIQCGGCMAPETCGAVTPSQCGVVDTCTNLCLQQVTCPGNGTTKLTGKVYAPNGVDPLPNVLVYVPNAPVQPFPTGVACDNCGSGVTGAPLVSAATDTAGNFTLTNVPVGTNIPLVIQTGRWRRQVTIPNVMACQNNAVPPALSRLPKNKSEGDIPKIAFATGAVDALECVLRKIGVADSEFTASTGSGRIHLYVGDGKVNIPGPGGGMYFVGGANAGAGTASETTLVGSLATMKQYDMLLFPCKGAEKTRSSAELANMVQYANAGGRVFATHFSYVWLYNNAPFSSTANWAVTQMPNPADQNGLIDTSFPKGQALSEWLQNIGASTTPGQIPIQVLKHDFDGLVPPSQRWMYINNPNLVMHYTFNTPVGSPAEQQCGRVLFDDFHVENHGYIDQGSAYGLTFPSECDNAPMNPQEKLLEFMIFDLGSCVTPDVPTCKKSTCAAQSIQCGPAGDGCGGLLDCGACSAGKTCGGGGQPSVCGAPTCTPKTCAQQNVQCGPAGDGCGSLLQCGSCPAGQTCGGGGVPGVCGAGACNPLTCAAQSIQCGPAGDGCGNLLDCGSCPAGKTCGGGGTPGVCGSSCTPKTCAALGFNCGLAGDGCGGQIDCGVCSAPQTCGGGGKPNVCGGSIPQ
ncbi:Tryptophan synthase alpha chain [Minicystis rosea]|nr:Tryptophan synthase alpha chain [Minicystis rosea]